MHEESSMHVCFAMLIAEFQQFVKTLKKKVMNSEWNLRWDLFLFLDADLEAAALDLDGVVSIFSFMLEIYCGLQGFTNYWNKNSSMKMK